MKNVFILALTVATLPFSAPAFAEHHEAGEGMKHDHATMENMDHEAFDCKNAINVSVNGMVCDFCARALEKVFGEREEVAGINIDLDKSLVQIHMKDGQTIADEDVTKLITDSGYDVASINKGCEADE